MFVIEIKFINKSFTLETAYSVQDRQEVVSQALRSEMRGFGESLSLTETNVAERDRYLR